MHLLILPQNKEKDLLDDLHRGIHRGLLVSIGTSTIKGKLSISSFSAKDQTFSGSIEVKDLPASIIKTSDIGMLLKGIPEFKDWEEVATFISTIEDDPEIPSGELAKQNVIYKNPTEDAKPIVINAKSDQVHGPTGKAKEEPAPENKANQVKENPPVKQEIKSTQQQPQQKGKMANLFNKKQGKGKGQNQKSTTTVKDLSQLPQAVKNLEKAPGFTKIPDQKAHQNPAPQKKNDTKPSPKVDKKEVVISKSERLKETLKSKKEANTTADELWPGGVVVPDMSKFQEKGFVIGHLLKKGDKPADILIVGTPKTIDGSAALTLLFPDKNKADFYFNAASSHPKLTKFLEMCSVKKLSEFTDVAELNKPGLLIQDPLKYVEHLVNRLAS